MPVVAQLAAASVWFADGPEVLSEVDLTIRSGEHWALLGPNGAGKSTLLSLVGAKRFPSAGSVTILGHLVGRVDLRELRREIGAVDAAARMPATMPVGHYIATGMTATVQSVDQDRYDDWWPAVHAAAELCGVASIINREVGVLSQGERSRCRVARAIVSEPDLLLLDEPASGLDLPGRADLLAAVERLARDRTSLASVTVAHHLEELPATTTHVALLAGGRLVASGGVELLGDEATLSQTFARPVRSMTVGGRWFAVAGPIAALGR